MELSIKPDHLYAASAALRACRARLDDDVQSFAHRAASDLPDVGASAAEAAGNGISTTERAAALLVADLDRLVQALAALAHHYPRVDATAVRAR